MLAGLLVPVANLAVGIGLVRGAVPKFGLAYAGVAGALAIGQLLIEVYRGSSRRPAGGRGPRRRARADQRCRRGRGWILGVVALGLTVLAGIVAVVAWGRTVMDDGEALDPGGRSWPARRCCSASGPSCA